MFDENEGANERDGYSCAMMMFAYLASTMLAESFIYFSRRVDPVGCIRHTDGRWATPSILLTEWRKGLVFIFTDVLDEPAMRTL